MKKRFIHVKYNNESSHVRQFNFAFTLAEVLITLGIIGIVAALTLPALTAKYKKHEVETSLKKFYTSINHAIMLSENDNGDKKEWAGIDVDGAYGEQTLKEVYNRYYKKYIKVVKTDYDSVNRGLLLFFADGSVAKLGYNGQDIFYCVSYKDYLRNYEGTAGSQEGKSCFTFGFYPTNSANYGAYFNKGIEPYVNGSCWDGTIESLNNSNMPECYAKIIQMNGWVIPDDYPVKF